MTIEKKCFRLKSIFDESPQIRKIKLGPSILKERKKVSHDMISSTNLLQFDH